MLTEHNHIAKCNHRIAADYWILRSFHNSEKQGELGIAIFSFNKVSHEQSN